MSGPANCYRCDGLVEEADEVVLHRHCVSGRANTSPATMEGKMLAAFLRGLIPETDQFDRQIADIEAAARVYCPCAWQCHETTSPCSFSCMAHHAPEQIGAALKRATR